MQNCQYEFSEAVLGENPQYELKKLSFAEFIFHYYEKLKIKNNILLVILNMC